MSTIELINYINAPAEKVYSALTTQKGLASTWTHVCQIATGAGGEHAFGFGDEPPTKFKVVAQVPKEQVTWLCTTSDPEWVGTQLDFILEEKNGKTAITLQHSGWKEVSEYFRWCNYNWAFFLYSLKLYCEEGKGIPFQERKF